MISRPNAGSIRSAQLLNGVLEHHRQEDAPSEEEQQVEETSATLYRAVCSDVNRPLNGVSTLVGAVNVDDVALNASIADVHRYAAAEFVHFQFTIVAGQVGRAQRPDEPDRSVFVSDNVGRWCSDAPDRFIGTDDQTRNGPSHDQFVVG
ncbi:MAG: hypothetical protein CMB34_01675 [Euryarchaeota archaeon]|nr:hypothetical protein [Euryarchaeota archaeon]